MLIRCGKAFCFWVDVAQMCVGLVDN